MEVSAAEDARLGRRIAGQDVDRRLRSHERDVGAVGQQRRHGFVAALRGGDGLLDALLLEIAIGDRDVGRHIKHRAHHLVVADLCQRLLLRTRDARRGKGESAGGEAALDDASAVEHVLLQDRMHGRPASGAMA